jgi:hypothetical protein
MSGAMEDHRLPRPSPAAKWAPAAMAAAALVVYLFSLPPEVHFGGDCGEIACSTWTLGVGHPTGYPLYQMVGKLLELLVPFGSIAWRAALLSALAAAAAVALMTKLVLVLTDDPLAAVMAGAVLLCDSAIWSLADIAVPHLPHQLLILALTYSLLRFAQTDDVRWVNLTGLTFGLGAVHHVSMAFNAPAVVLFFVVLLWRRGPDGRRLRRLPGLAARAAGWALAVMALYVYLPLRAACHPAMNWGACDTWSGFVGHITGRIYRTGLLDVSPLEARRFAANHLQILAWDQGLAAPLAAIGLALLLWRQTPLGLYLLAAAAWNLNFAAHYRVGNRINYALPLHTLAPIAAGYGAAQARLALARWSERATVVRPATLRLVGAVLVGLLPIWPNSLGSAPVRRGWDMARMWGNRRAANQIDAVLADAPSGAILACSLDELTNALWYRQIIDGQRRDLGLIQQPYVDEPWQQAQLRAKIDAAAARGPVDLTFYQPQLSQHYGLTMGRATLAVGPLGGERPLPFGPPSVEPGWRLPGCPEWTLAKVTAWAPNTMPDGHGALLPAIRSRLLGYADCTLAVAQAGGADWDLLLVAVQSDLERQLAGEITEVPPVLNEGNGQVERWWVTRWPLRPAATPSDHDWRATVTARAPLWAPDCTVNGGYWLRVGLVRRDDRRWPTLMRDLRSAREASVKAATFMIYVR